MAVGMPNLIPYLWYFWNNDVKHGYYTKTPEIYRDQQIQALIYRLNQPWIRSDQCAFTNVSIFDHPYFESIFGGTVFPDGTPMIDYEEEIIQFQKDFINVVNKIREENIFTFPVLTASLLYQNNKFVDEDFAKWACEASMKWNLFNFFTDSSVNSLSNCPLSPDTKILYWSDYYQQFKLSPIKEVYNNREERGKNEIEVLSNGQRIKCKINKFEIAPEYEITLVNGAKIKTTANHLNKTYRGDEIRTKDLTVDDYLPYGRHAFEENNFLTYEEGVVVGAFLGDGSYSSDNYSIDFSLNVDTDCDFIDWLMTYLPERFGAKCSIKIQTSSISGNSKCAVVHCNSKYLRGLIEQCVEGDNALNKALNLKILNYSKKFRNGIIDGWSQTDGGNSNRIYTSSAALVETANVLFASLGMVTRINEDNRENRLGSNVCYTVRYYTPKNRRKLKDVYLIDDDYMWIKIASITRCKTKATTSYCLEVLEDVEPYFMLGNGVITHNCRLKSDITDLYFNSIGGTALKVGSVKVCTLNLARLSYKHDNEKDYLVELKSLTQDCLEILDSVRHIIKRNVEKGLLPNFSSGLIDFQHLYNTVGINGIYETMKTFGYTYGDEFGNIFYKDEAYDFGKKIFKVIQNTADNFILDKDYHVSLEQIPAEQAAVKLLKSDKIMYPDKVVLDLPLYGNQWIPLGIKTTLAERIKICAAFDKFCNGGSILHANIENTFNNFEQAWNMLKYVTSQGVTYFAFNSKVSQCENNHSFYGDICPICHERKKYEYTRTVGFYTKTATWSKERQEEYKLRQWEKINA